ncbi:MAG: tRNA (adenosine(37)-N6)-threonylcarbamoyltransferase complex transferase subunit TsaD [Candidatus Omnitrophica bacterium]|nr:tRNA (adenosine(37)-N6)-threonylcarbamoyltransferase complex transferase subunit TsaD [Candidatus Omnitrophota bacterium]
MKKALTLGIETSCDETSVSLVNEGRVLSNVVSSSVHLHKKYGGVVPEIASRFHVEYILEVLSRALEGAGKGLGDIGLVAVTNGPGLVGALLTGISLAKSLSYSLDLPLIGVNHVFAHLYSAFLNDEKPRFPFVGLAISGGHTALLYCEDVDRYKLLGQTQDDAVGEAYDKVAKILGLGYPGGPVIEKMAARSKNRNNRLFPKSFMGENSLDFSFSGVKTAVLYYVRGKGQGSRVQGRVKRKMAKDEISDVCYSFQEAVLDMVVEKAFQAAEMKGVKDIVLGGGVTANSRLREKFYDMARFYHNRSVHFPDFQYCLDNAAMVAALGRRLYAKGYRSDLFLSAKPNLEVS